MEEEKDSHSAEKEKQLLDEKKVLYRENQAANQKRTISLKNLDSNIKRNTSFIKKLKEKLGEEQKEALCQELQLLNLSRYVSEVVNAIAEAKLKPSDTGAAVKICSLLHQRYADFTLSLIPALTKHFAPQKPATLTEQERNAIFVRKRSSLRLLGELYLIGIYNDADVIFKILQELIHSEQSKDIKENRENGFQNLSLVVSFCRSVGEELIGLHSKKLAQQVQSKLVDANGEPISNAVNLSDNIKKNFVQLLNSYFDTASQWLIQEHKELRKRERENHHILETKGELNEANSQAYDKLRRSHEKLLTQVGQFGDLLDRDVPPLPGRKSSQCELSSIQRIQTQLVFKLQL